MIIDLFCCRVRPFVHPSTRTCRRVRFACSPKRTAILFLIVVQLLQSANDRYVIRLPLRSVFRATFRVWRRTADVVSTAVDRHRIAKMQSQSSSDRYLPPHAFDGYYDNADELAEVRRF